ncbi:LuxR C-terminal-related transcriptional regulator [Caballeronia sp. Lep1P3]|uniref:LuxR C-terminal-related transcriptional regulator n=1 Tax=Caballeronia sp. Lep1P3 TaxID=2878150 RepID=UPI001FD4420A|nr:LuxR C-terminal-related transcriptional regulator [Caballeronia sp. Lep1P3]
MTTPFNAHLLSTRFSPPRIGAKHVARTHLLAEFERMRECRLALVTGGAGYGKTTLLAQCRQACIKAGAEVAWLSLTADDKGYVDFCTALFAAMHRGGIPVEADLPLEESSALAMDASIAAIVEAAVDVPHDLYLVIDDYHYVEAPLAHRFMQKLLDFGPGNLHLVIASRVSPPLSLSRLRMMGQIVELDSAALPFDIAETRAFVDENLGAGKLNADELTLIHELTSGWPSCIQLIAVMLKNRPETRSTLRDLVWRSSDLQTYLSEEVMAYLPAEVAEFAEALSVFRRFSAPLARAVTGAANAADLLKRMEDDNLPLMRVDSDDRATWFRFHPLFAEFLATRLARREPGAVRELHRRAARWFADHDLLAEAVRHASIGADVEFATSVVERAAPATWSLEYLSPTLRLLEHLPEEALFRHRRLLLIACLAVALTTRSAKAKAWLAQLQTRGDPGDPDDAALARGVPVIEAAIAFQQDDTARMIELLEPHRDAQVGNPFMQYMLLAELSAAYGAAGRYADAKRLFDTHPIPPADADNDMALVAQATRASALLLQGNVREAERVGSALLARSVQAVGRHSISANVCASVLADVYYELDRIDDARETIANRRGLLQSSGPDVMIRTSLSRARLDLLQESADTALVFLQHQIAQMRSMRQMRAAAHMLAETVRVLLVKGDRTRALDAYASLEELAASHVDEHGFKAEIPAIAALAKARLLRDEKPDDALRALQLTRAHAEAFGRERLAALADLLSATILADQKRADDARLRMVRAVEGAERLGLVRTIIDEGPAVGKLLATMVRERKLEGSTLRYAMELIEKYPDAVAEAASVRRSVPSKLQPVLTQREVEVLGLVAQAMSNKRIALALNITLETVKWNLRNIFGKLGVSSRYDAMVWARKRELIE